jgi:hypothetical protein
MDDSLYDEFGNYIGPELDGSEEVRQRGFLSAFSDVCCISMHVHDRIPSESAAVDLRQPDQLQLDRLLPAVYGKVRS